MSERDTITVEEYVESETRRICAGLPDSEAGIEPNETLRIAISEWLTEQVKMREASQQKDKEEESQQVQEAEEEGSQQEAVEEKEENKEALDKWIDDVLGRCERRWWSWSWKAAWLWVRVVVAGAGIWLGWYGFFVLHNVPVGVVGSVAAFILLAGVVQELVERERR